MKISLLLKIIVLQFIFISCSNPIERSGYVIDEDSMQPLEGVSVDIYMKHQRRDSLQEKVFTDSNGYFFVAEKRDDDILFLMYKYGYIGYTSSLKVANDTILFERVKAD
jgi:hypothetical protein